MRILLAGATGTIGRAVATALEAHGHEVVALIRAQGALSELESRRVAVVVHDLAHEELSPDKLGNIDAVISCLGSRSGGIREAEEVEYLANARLLSAAQKIGVVRFVLLSAICVQRPRLAFQRQKLRFEALLKASKLAHTIVRPTAYFKSLSGQVARVRANKPFLIFGDGTLTACKPISDHDLANFMVEQLTNPSASNQTLAIGGPGPAITPREQGAMLCQALGKVPRYKSVNPQFFLRVAAVLQVFAGLSGWLRDRAEFMRIAHYYATESMLVWDEQCGAYRADLTPEYGRDSLAEHYVQLAGNSSEIAGANPHKLFS